MSSAEGMLEPASAPVDRRTGATESMLGHPPGPENRGLPAYAMLGER